MADAALVGVPPEADPGPAPRDLVADGIEAMEKIAADERRAAFSFEHGGETFTLRDQVDLRVIVGLQRGNFFRALELALVGGVDDVDRLLATDDEAPLDEDRLTDMMENWARALGTSLGESAGSSR